MVLVMLRVYLPAFVAGVVYLAVVSLVCIAYLKAIYARITMNDTEKTALANLNDRVERMATLLSNERAENSTLKTENESLKAQLAAVPPPADDSAEVIAAVQAIEAKADAALVDPSAVPPTPPAA